jgi:hypothetical protein
MNILTRTMLIPLSAVVFISSSGVITAGPAATNAVVEKLPVPSHWTPITSHKRHFIVTDFPRCDALSIAVWAESARQRFVDWATVEIPGEQGFPMVMTAERRPGEPQGRVLKAQGFSDSGQRQQEITMINPAAMDQEDVLEAMSWLFMNQWIHVRQPVAERIKNPGKFPDWLAVGVAQNLYPELKERNFREIRALEANGGYQPASATFNDIYLPPGRWPEKARAGLIVTWLAERFTPAELLTRTAEIAAQHKSLDAAAIVHVTGLPDARTLNMEWDIWMSRQEHKMIPGVLSLDDTDVLRILELRPEDVGLVYPDPLPNDRLSAEILIQHRDKTWAREASRSFALKLRQEAIGKSPELLAGINRFVDYFDSIALSRKSAGELEKQWTDAQEKWNTYRMLQEKQSALLDDYTERGAENTNAVQQIMNQWEKSSP